MQDQPRPAVPRHVTDVLDGSVRDIADGQLHDAEAVQAEARLMLADYERTRPARPGSPPEKRTRAA